MAWLDVDTVHQVSQTIAVALAPVVATALAAALAAALGYATLAFRKWGQKLGLEGETVNKANKEADILAALKFGIAHVLPVAEEKGWDSPEFREAALKAGTLYLQDRFPLRAAELGGSPKDDSTVYAALMGRLPEAVTAAAASPATPPQPDKGATITAELPAGTGASVVVDNTG